MQTAFLYTVARNYFVKSMFTFPPLENLIQKLQQALEIKKLGKREKAHKLLVHALSMNPDFVDALTELGTILEEKDVVQADHLYTKALAISPCNKSSGEPRPNSSPG